MKAYQKYVHHGQLDKGSLDNTCSGLGAWQASSICNSHIRQGYHARHRTTLVHTWGAWQTRHPLLVKTTTPDLRQAPSTQDITLFNTGQPFLPVNQLRAWGTYILSRTHKSYMASYMALRDTCPSSTSALLQERGRLSISRQAPQQTGYL